MYLKYIAVEQSTYHVLNSRYVVKCRWLYLYSNLRMEEKLIQGHIRLPRREERAEKRMPGVMETEGLK